MVCPIRFGFDLLCWRYNTQLIENQQIVIKSILLNTFSVSHAFPFLIIIAFNIRIKGVNFRGVLSVALFLVAGNEQYDGGCQYEDLFHDSSFFVISVKTEICYWFLVSNTSTLMSNEIRVLKFSLKVNTPYQDACDPQMTHIFAGLP